MKNFNFKPNILWQTCCCLLLMCASQVVVGQTPGDCSDEIAVIPPGNSNEGNPYNCTAFTINATTYPDFMPGDLISGNIGNGESCNGDLDQIFVEETTTSSGTTCLTEPGPFGSGSTYSYTTATDATEVIVYACRFKGGNPNICNLTVGPSCSFEVTCPTTTNLGSIFCGDTPPAVATTVAEFEALTGADIGDEPCGTIVIQSEDSALGSTCNNQTITRTYTIFDDLDGDGELDAEDEESETCELTYVVLASPAILAFEDQVDDIVACGALPAAGSTFEATNDQGSPCERTATMTLQPYTAPDACGGMVTLSWSGIDNCGSTRVHQETVTVSPASAPEIIAPVFDAIITCDAATAFMAGDGSYTNNGSGTCLISGDITPVIGGAFDECGGNITVTYAIPTGVLCTGQVVAPVVRNITVSPAPDPMIDAPMFNEAISCDAATTFSAGDGSYTNNGSGTCLISGTIPADVNANFTNCGGSITVTYAIPTGVLCTEGTVADVVRNITVNAAPAPTFTNPPGNITVACGAVPAVSSLNYTNGENTPCTISGMETSEQTAHPGACGGTITETWTIASANNCERGDIVYARTITVMAAPAPVFACPADLPATLSCAAAQTFTTTSVAIDNGLAGDCLISANAVPVVHYSNINVCGAGSFVRITYTVTEDMPVSGCNPAYTVVCDIPVEAAPAPAMFTCPADLPTTLTCAAAETFTLSPVNIDNTLTGSCLIEAIATPIINKNYDACGGTISVSYQVVETQNCNAPYTVACTDITVSAAAAPVFDTPPAAVDIACDATVPPAATLSYTNSETGTCEISGAAFPVDVIADGACPGLGTITRTWTVPAADDCADAGITASQIITIIDMTPPEILNCKEDCVLNVDGSNCDATVKIEPPIAIDDCGGDVTITYTVDGAASTATSLTIPAGESRTIEFTVSDCSDNKDTCTYTITIEDNDDPVVICPPNLTVCADAGTCTWSGSGLALTNALEDCDFTTTHTIVSADGSIDVMNAMGDVADGTLFPLGTSTITYTIEEDLDTQNTATCSFTVTVTDCEAPEITCPMDVTDADCGTVPTDTQLLNAISAADNCDEDDDIVFTATLIGAQSGCGDTETLFYEFTATDAAGNSSTCIATYTTVDEVDPIISDASDLTLECDGTGQSAAIVAWLNSNGGSTVTTEVCGMVTWTNDFAGLTETCNTVGTTSVIFTATDECGNTATTTAAITIQDTTAPVLNDPGNLVLECNFANNEEIVANWLASASATDDCGAVTVSNDFAALPSDCVAGANSVAVIFTVVGNCDAEVVTITKTKTITLEDNQAPEFTTVPADIYVECTGLDATGAAAAAATAFAAFGGAVAADDCDSAVGLSVAAGTAQATCGGTFTVPVTITATDDCGNATSEIAYYIIQDTIAPDFAVENNAAVECDAADPDAWAADAVAANTIVEVCGATTTTFELIDIDNSCDDSVVYTYGFSVTDGCNNTAYKTATYEITDSTPPVVNAPINLSVNCDADVSAAILAWLATATITDNCDADPQLTNNFDGTPPTCGDVETVTFTGTDDCSNMVATATATITVTDDLAPVLTVPDNITVECGPNQAAIIEAWENDALAIDNCDGTVAVNFAASALVVGTCANTGTITYTFDAVDACTNMATIERTVTIVDTQKPVIMTPPSDLIVECNGMGNTTEIETWTDAFGGMMAMDNCGTVDLSFEAGTAVTTCGGTQTIPYTFTATDACGNAISEVAYVQIVDTTDPAFSVLPTNDVVCGVNNLETWAAATAIDDCSSVEVTYAISNYEQTIVTGILVNEVYTVLFTATDDCGNVTTDTRTYTVVATPPTTTEQTIEIQCSVEPSGTVSLSQLFPGIPAEYLDNSATNVSVTVSGGGAIVGGALQYTEAGCYAVTWTYTDPTALDLIIPCDYGRDVTSFVFVSEEPTPSFDIQNEVCISAGDAAVVLTPTVNSPNTYNNDALTPFTINDANLSNATATINATTGVVTITAPAGTANASGYIEVTLTETINYAACGTTMAGNCTETFTTRIDVQDGTALDASFIAVPNPVCIGDAVTLTPTVNGGLFTGVGVIDNGLGTGGTFTSATAGIYVVSYLLNDDSGCSNAYSLNIEVGAAVNAELADLVMDCGIDPVGNVSLTALFTENTTLGGTFVLENGAGGQNGVNGVVNGYNLQYNGPGCYRVEYTVSSYEGADGACTESQVARILIPETPQPSFDLAEEVCWDGSEDFILTPFVNSPAYDTDFNDIDTTWTTSDASIATLLVDGAGAFEIVGSGTVEICYTETITTNACGGNGPVNCATTYCETLTITETDDQVSAAWTTFGPVCSDDAVVSLVVTGDAGGVFTGEGIVDSNITGAPNAETNIYTFNPMMVTIPAGETSLDVNICYTVNNGSGCTAVECHDITVYAPVDGRLSEDLLMDCSIDPVGNISLDALFTATTTPGGTFELLNEPGNGINGVIAGNTLQYNGPGCYRIEYTVTAFEGADGACIESDIARILVPETPQPSFDLAEEVCWDGSVGVTLTSLVNSPAYDTDFGVLSTAWTAVDPVTDGVSTVASVDANGVVTILTAGTLEVCYEETITTSGCGGAVDCATTYCETLTITETDDAVSAAWMPFGPVCSDDAVVSLVLTGDAGGVFTGEGIVVVEVEDGTNTYTFDPTTVTIPTGEESLDVNICYTVNNGSGCTAVECNNIRVYAPVDGSLVEDLVMDCGIDPIGNISLSALFTETTTPGGVFELLNGGNPVNAASNTFGANGVISGYNLQYNGPGCYEVRYVVSAFNGADGACESSDIVRILIPENPQPSFELREEVCWDGSEGIRLSTLVNSPIYDLSFGNLTGNWRSTNTGVVEVDEFGEVTIMAAGTAQICYEEVITNDCDAFASACSGEFCKLISITETADAIDPSWLVIGPFCVDDMMAYDLDVQVTGTPNGDFTGLGVTEEFNGGNAVNDYTFTPSLAGVGIHAICYTVSNESGCESVLCRNIEVLPTVNADINNLTVDCSIDPSGSISLSSMFGANTAIGGTFTVDGVQTNVLNYDGPGCYVVTYEVSSTAVNGTLPSLVGACTDSDVATIFILEEPQPSFDMPEEVCFGEGGPSIDINAFVNSPTYDGFGTLTGAWELTTSEPTITLTDNGTSGAVITVDGDITTSVTVTLCYTETLSFTGCDDDGVAGNNDDDASQADTTCDAFVCQTLTINDSSDTVDPSFTQVGPFCISDADFYLGAINGDAGVVTGQLGGEFTGNAVYEGSAVGVPATGTSQYWFSPAQAGEGVHSVTYTVSSQEGCTASFTQNIVVYESVNVATEIAQSSYCLSDSNIDFSTLFSSTGDGGVTDFDDDDGEYYLNGTAYFGSDLVINPALVGVHTITYCVGNLADQATFTNGMVNNTFTDCTTCAQAAIEICDTPNPDWTAPAFLCEDGASPDAVFVDQFVGNTYPLIPNNLGVQGDDYTSYSWVSEAGQLFMDANATMLYGGGELTTETIYFLPAGLSDQSEVEICLTVIGAGELQEGGIDLCEGCMATRCYEIPIISEYQADLNLNSGLPIAVCLEDFVDEPIIDLTQYLSNTTPGNGYFTITHHGADGIIGTADDVVAENCSLGGTIVGCQNGFIWDITTLGSSGLASETITIRYTVEGSGQCTRYDEFTLVLEAPAEDCFEPDALVCENDFGAPINAYDWLVEGCISCDTTWVSSIDGSEDLYEIDYQSADNAVNDGVQLPGDQECINFINTDIAINSVAAPLIPEGSTITYLKLRWSYEGTCGTSEGDLDSATILFPSGNELTMTGTPSLPYPNDGGPNGNDHYGWQEFVITGDLLDTYADELAVLSTCESINPFQYIVQSNSANWTIGFEVEVRWNTCSFEAFIHETADEDGAFNDTIYIPNADLGITAGFYQSLVEDENGISQVVWEFDSNGLNAIDGSIDVVFNNAICGDCPSQEVQSILVADNYGAAFTTDENITVCSNAGQIDLTQYLAAGSDNGGNFTSADVTINGDILAIDNVMTADGCVEIIYDVADFVNTCGVASDTLTLCVIEQAPQPDLSAIDGEQVCEGDLIPLTDYQVGTWTSTNSVVNADLVADQTQLNTTGYSQYNPISLTYTIPGQCGSSQTITVIVESSFDAVLVDDIDACIGNLGDVMVVSVQPDGTECIDLDQFVSDDATTAPNFGAGFWSLAATSTAGTLTGAILCPDGVGTYDLVYTIPGSTSGTECGAVRDLTIVISEQEAAMFTLPDLLCSNDLLPLTAEDLVATFEGEICISGNGVATSITDPSYGVLQTISLALPEIPAQSKVLGLEIDYNYVGFGNANGDLDTLGIAINGTEMLLGLANSGGPNGDNHFEFEDADNIVLEEGAAEFSSFTACDDNTIDLAIISNSALWDACIMVTMTYTTGEFTASLPSGASLESYGYDSPIVAPMDGSGAYSFDASALCDVDQVAVTFTRFGCTACGNNSTTQTIDIVCGGQATLVEDAMVCYTSEIDLDAYLAEGTSPDGVFSGMGVSGDVLLPMEGVTEYTITYEYGASGSLCYNSDEIVITILPKIITEFDAPATLCSLDGDTWALNDYLADDASSGGTWSLAMGEATLTGSTLSAAGYTGLIELVYTVDNGTCEASTSQIIEIVHVVQATLEADQSVCWDNFIDLTQFFAEGTTYGGYFSGSNDIDGYSLYPSEDGGNYTIMYTVGDAEWNCGMEMDEIIVTVDPAINALWDAPSSFCSYQTNIDMTNYLTQFTDMGGMWSIAAGGGTIDAVSGIYNSDGIDGFVEFHYTITTPNGCSETHAEIVTVLASAGADVLPSVVCLGETIDLSTLNVTPGGVWFGSGVAGTTFTASTPGDKLIYYEVGGSTCGNIFQVQVAGEPMEVMVSDIEAVCADSETTPEFIITGGFFDHYLAVVSVDGEEIGSQASLPFYGMGATFNPLDVLGEDWAGLATVTFYAENQAGCLSDPISVDYELYPAPAITYVLGCTDPVSGLAAMTVGGLSEGFQIAVYEQGTELTMLDYNPVNDDLAIVEAGVLYNIAVINGNGCEAKLEGIKAELAIDFDASISCIDEDGLVTVNITVDENTGYGSEEESPYEYSYDGGLNYVTESTYVVAADENTILSVRVKDSKGCLSAFQAFNLGNSGELAPSVACNENGIVSIDLGYTGSSYSAYYILNGEEVTIFSTTFDVAVAEETTLTIVVNDNSSSVENGCELTGQITVYPAIELTVTPDLTACATETVATTINASGGNGLFELVIDGGAVINLDEDGTMENLGVGMHEITVTDASGCSATTSIDIPEGEILDQPVLVYSESLSSATSVCGSETLTLTVTGGETYQWTVDEEVQEATGNTLTGTYDSNATVMVATTSGECVSETLEIDVTYYPALSSTEPMVTCNGDGTYTVDFEISGGNITQPYFVNYNGISIESVGVISATYTIGTMYSFEVLSQESGCSLMIEGTDDCIDPELGVGCSPILNQGSLSCEEGQVTVFVSEAGDNFEVIGVEGATGFTSSVENGFGGVVVTFNLTQGASDFTMTYLPGGNGCSGALTYGISIDCSNVTAIDLLRFDGEVQENGNLLSWVTAQEQAADYFTLERSKDGVSFQAITNVNAVGNSTVPQAYSFIDVEADNGISYYRLLETDMSGETTVVSEVIELNRFVQGTFGIVDVYPIPTSNELTIEFISDVATDLTIDVYSVLGNMVKSTNVEAIMGSNTTLIDVSNFSTGTYFVTINNGEQILRAKFIVD